ncbi:IS630 family transposase [Aquimarina longa]|uniref:IS630 family transposase n=1 Tax=Aquimarina longa TaxID=1080221 RepID=UPI000785831D|nr:IS630 family transposase [Aquimarina longa]
MIKPKRFLKNLENLFTQIRTGLDKNKYDTVNLYFQDESRFGLITKQKRVISARGVQPIGKYKHSYQYKWLWGSFSPISGESFCMTTDGVCKELFIKYLEDFAKHKPREVKILIIDNAAFHSTKNVTIPENIILLPIPPYSPELNPAEKVWQWMKDKMAMKIFDTLEDLEYKIDQLLETLENQLIKSITAYQFYIQAYYNAFKV